MDFISKIQGFLAECRNESRNHGWSGDDDDYEYTECDMEYITDRLGYKPTRNQWRMTGLKYIGEKHCS